MTKPSPFRETDDEARSLAKRLLGSERHAALAVLEPDRGHPQVTRIALAPAPDGQPLTLISDLSGHTRALKANRNASLLVGSPGDKGDPLTWPRITLAVTASFIDRDHPDHGALRAAVLEHQPKAALYIDFADFNIVRFNVEAADLNGGFGKAYHLTPADLGLA